MASSVWRMLWPLLCIALLSFSRGDDAAAEVPPIWLKPAKVTSADSAVRVDGEYALADSVEYVKGRRIPLSNWMGDWPGFAPPDGELYIQLHAPDSPIRPARLYIGVKLPRFWDQNSGRDSGNLELYFAFNDQECGQSEDRKITMRIDQVDAPSATLFDAAPTLTWITNEFEGNPAGTCTSSQPVSEPQALLRRAELKMDEFDGEKFLFAEFEIAMPPSVYAADRLRLGVKYRDEDYGSAQCPRCCSAVLTLPNDPLAQQGTPSQLDWGRESTYQVFDLKEPELTTLGVSAYNVGQMLDLGASSVFEGDLAELSDVFVGNGGVGDPEDIANAIWSRDIVCLSEVMMYDDRKDIVEHANEIRADHDLPRFRPVMVDGDDSPNVMLLSWWRPILNAEVIKYSAIDPAAGGPDDSYLGSSRGAKGVAWARLGPPPKCQFGPPDSEGHCPENAEVFDSHQWIDVFCTHTQAPCSPGGSDECDEEKDHHLNAVRQKQFVALGKFIKQKRAILEPFGSGFDRPALVLGDLNQVGPRSRAENWGNDGKMDDWLQGNLPASNNDIYWGEKAAIAVAYKGMREKIGNWLRTDFDRRTADDYISGYDLTGNTNGEGSWIGKEHEGQVGDSQSDDCTASFPNLKNEARVDYVMLIPATEKFPSLAARWAPNQPQSAVVDRHFKPTADFSFEDEGCLSDHAEVIAYIQLVPAALPEPVNPFRENRLYYSPAQLHDVDDADDTFGDDGTTDWYTDHFYLQTRDFLGNETGKCEAHWSDDITPDGRTVTPGWRYRSHPMKGKDTALAWLEVSDHDTGPDDYYDSHSRSPCKHTELVFKLDELQVIEQGCQMSITRVIGQGKGLGFISKGNGDDDDVQISNILAVCEIKHDPGCDLICGP